MVLPLHEPIQFLTPLPPSSIKPPTPPRMQPPSPSSDAAMLLPPNRRKPGPPEASSLHPPPPQQPALRCPRCDSTNTKFCYYNNYSLSQPRHFCKTCRRYWTKGGSLRNIPIGGASRKSKKSSRSSSSSSAAAAADQIGGLKLFHPSMADYPPNLNLSSPFGDLSLNPFAGGGTGLNFDNFSLTSGLMSGGGLIVSSGAATTNGGGGQVASSIESLSAHNLELHWKMQQQRMAMLYGGVGCSSDDGGGAGGGDSDNDNYQKQDQGEGVGEGGTAVVTTPFVGVGPVMTSAHVERPQPIFFQNLEVITNNAKPQHQHDHHHLLRSSLSSLTGNGDQAVAATEWFFDSSYGGGGGDDKSNGKNKESSTNGINATSSSFSNGGAQGWGDDQFHQFNGLV